MLSINLFFFFLREFKKFLDNALAHGVILGLFFAGPGIRLNHPCVPSYSGYSMVFIDFISFRIMCICSTPRDTPNWVLTHREERKVWDLSSSHSYRNPWKLQQIVQTFLSRNQSFQFHLHWWMRYEPHTGIKDNV